MIGHNWLALFINCSVNAFLFSFYKVGDESKFYLVVNKPQSTDVLDKSKPLPKILLEYEVQILYIYSNL